jgi:hypothetical protein
MGRGSSVAGQFVEAATQAYVSVCSKVPFDQLQAMTSEIPLIQGTAVYSLAAYNMFGLISVRLTFNAGYGVRRLRRSHVRHFDSYLDRQGTPATYARFGTSLQLSPIPNNSTDTIRARYWSRPTIPTNPNEVEDTVLLTPVEWDELLEWETLYRMYIFTEQHDKANLLMQVVPMPRQFGMTKTRTFEMGIIPRLWNDLLKTESQREGTDEDFSINPVRRSYTYGGR